MGNKAVRLSTVFVLIVLFLLPAQVFAAEDIEVIITVDDNMECRMTTFEGARNYAPINPDLDYLIPELQARFPGGWMTLTSGGYENNPSPTTIAFWVDNRSEVLFDEPVAAVGFYYSSASTHSIRLEAVDAGGNVVARIDGPPNCLSGRFDIWDPIGIALDENVIARLRVMGAPGYVAIDDFWTCRFLNHAPVVNSATADPAQLWPPNHKLMNVTVTINATDPDGPEDIVRTTYAVADEYGEYDMAETDLPEDGVISLISDRDGKDKDGRVYTVTVTVYDAGGLSDSSSFDVVVSHDQGK